MRSINRYIYGLIIAILLIVLIVFLANNPKSNNSSTPLVSSYSNQSSYVEVYLRGPITSNQDHNDISITVSADKVTMTDYVGYDGKVLDSRTYSNSSNSYLNFLKSLDVAGFVNSDKGSINSSSVGRCSFGEIYQFKIYKDDQKIQDLWTSDCDGVGGNFKGVASNVFTLFKLQVPDFNDLIQEVNLNTY